MYARKIIYRVYSIAMLVFGGIGFLSSLFFAFAIDLSAGIPALRSFDLFFKVLIVIVSLISLFFTYMEFSSMYAFTDMIEYEQSNPIHKMIKKGFILPPKAYSAFGTVLFAITAVSGCIYAVFVTVQSSIEKGMFICFPLIPLAAVTAECVLYYVHYYARYKAIADLLELVTADEVTEQTKQKLKEDKPGALRGYCIFLAVLCVLSGVAAAVLIIMTFGAVSAYLGISAAIGIAVAAVLAVALGLVCLGIFGCYVDNIAKMIEHYQIKYGLLDKEENKL